MLKPSRGDSEIMKPILSLFERHPGPYLCQKNGPSFSVADANGDYVFCFGATDANAELLMAELNARYRDDSTIFEVFAELSRADCKHPPMAESIEGFHTLLCEVTELQREVFRRNHDAQAMRKEAIQVAAMALKFLRDCCQITDMEE